AVISQTLLKTKDGSGRVAAHEIMIGTPAIRNLIRENKIAQMYSAIQTGRQLGMQTLDQNLQELVARNIISSAEARSKAANKEQFAGSGAQGHREGPRIDREQATKFMYDLLRALIAKTGSDLFIPAGYPPAMKIDNKMTPVSQQALTGQHTSMLVRAIMNDRQ